MAFFAAIGTFLPGLFGKEVPGKVAKAFGIGFVVLLALCALYIGKRVYDNAVIDRHEQEQEIAAGAAREDAAIERVEDAITNTKNEETLHEVVQSAPGGELSPAARALSCERLRQAGRVPPACRPASGD